MSLCKKLRSLFSSGDISNNEGVGSPIDIQNRVVEECISSVSYSWRKIEVVFEHYAWKGHYHEICVSFEYDKRNTKNQFFMSPEGNDLFVKLYNMMSTNNENWTWLKLIICDDGKYKFDFNYDLPKYVGDSLRLAGEIS